MSTTTIVEPVATDQRLVIRQVVAAAAPEEIFALLCDPAAHPGIDGTGTVQGVVEGPDRLSPDAEFSMRMKNGLGYTTHNRVVEYAEGRRIAWQHRARHIWRYELEPVAGGTRITETFDWSAKRAPRLVAAAGIPRKAAQALEATLQGLAERFGTP